MSPASSASTLAQHHEEKPPMRTTRPSNPTILTTPTSPTERRASIQSSTFLSSPSLAAARAYYHETVTPIGQKGNASQRRRSLLEGELIPRRHSAVVRSEILATQTANLGISCSNDQTAGKEVPASSLSKAGETSDFLMTDSSRDASTSKSGADGARRLSEIDILRPAPFHFTHNRLRDWGFVYLGNVATADALVNPMSLRRPSLAIVDEEHGRGPNVVTIRARVIPKSKARKPLLIQKDFDIEGLRASIEQSTKGLLRRSARARRSSLLQTSGQLGRSGSAESDPTRHVTTAGKAVPIRMYFLIQ